MSKHKHQRPGGLFDRPVQLLSATAAVLAFGWIWLVANFNPHEMILGFVVVTLSTAFCALVLRSASLPIELLPHDVLQVWRVPAAIVKDCGILLAVLFDDLFRGKPAGSLYRVCGFSSSRRNPVLIGRTSLAIMYTTMSPNMIVVGVDPDQSHMLFHQLKRDAVPELTKALGAGK